MSVFGRDHIKILGDYLLKETKMLSFLFPKVLMSTLYDQTQELKGDLWILV